MTGKISEDADAGVLVGTELIPVVVGGLNKTSTPDKIIARFSAGGTMTGPLNLAGQTLQLNTAAGSLLSDSGTTRAQLLAVGNRFDVISQDGLSAIFRAALTDTVPLFLGVEIKWSRANAITAFAGGGQTNATALTTRINRVTTVASANDSVRFPVSAAGMWIVVTNSGANSLQAYGAGTETINAVATATGVPIAAGKTGVYFCPLAGVWFGGTLA